MQRFECFLDGCCIVSAVDLVEIDIVGAEPAQAVVDLGHDRKARQAGAVGSRGYCQLHARSAPLPQVLPSSQPKSDYEGSPGRIAPSAKGTITSHAILTGGKTVTAELEVVVDRSVNGEEVLCVPD